MPKERNQLNYLKQIKKFYDGYKFRKYYPYFDTPIYLAAYSKDSIGINLINKITKSNQSFFNKALNIIRDTFYSTYFSSYKTFYQKNNFFYDKIIITWAFKKDFKLDGSFRDRYLNINSKKIKNTLWFIIYQDIEFPKKIKKNLFLFQPISKKKFSIFPIVKNLLYNLRYFLKR